MGFENRCGVGATDVFLFTMILMTKACVNGPTPGYRIENESSDRIENQNK